MLSTPINWSGPRQWLAVCDHKCEKAWGINGRRHFDGVAIEFDEDEPDDIVNLADHEVGDAPSDPGTYEGGHGKPMHPERHNKWCVRECERCELIQPGKPIEVRDYSVRHYNMPWLHPEAPEVTSIDTGVVWNPK